jgi:hypothetical protein
VSLGPGADAPGCTIPPLRGCPLPSRIASHCNSLADSGLAPKTLRARADAFAWRTEAPLMPEEIMGETAGSVIVEGRKGGAKRGAKRSRPL